MTGEAPPRAADGEARTREEITFKVRPPANSNSAVVSYIAGIPVLNLSEDEIVAAIDRLIADDGSHYAAVVNAAKIVAANRDEELKRVLIGADFVTADGMSVVWASRIQGQPITERVTGIDLFQRLVEHASRRGLSVYFLGARDGTARAVADIFARQYPALRIAGHHHGYFDEADTRSVSDAISGSAADLLFVAMGSPRQELWIASNLALTGVRFALGVGGSFDHVSGQSRRAPKWMQRSGLEWLHRFASEPRRLWRRYLIGNSAFIWLILRERLRRRRRS